MRSTWSGGSDEFRLLAFIDGGVVRVQQPLPGQIDRFDLAGTGMGFHSRPGREPPPTLAGRLRWKMSTRTKAGDKRVHFLVRQAW